VSNARGASCRVRSLNVLTTREELNESLAWFSTFKTE